MPTISIAEYQEYKQLKAKAQEDCELKILQENVPIMLENIGVILANKPLVDWPIFCLLALNKMPSTAKELYIKRLPKAE